MEELSGKFRKRKRSNFTQIPNSLLLNNEISTGAKGLYCLIAYNLDKMENIKDYVVYKTTIQNQSKEGRDAFNRMWKELKEAGYLKIYKITAQNNHFDYEYELLDEPNIDNSVDGKPVYGNPVYGDSVDGNAVNEEPVAENQEDGISVDIINTELTRKDNNTKTIINNNNIKHNVVIDKEKFISKIQLEKDKQITIDICDKQKQEEAQNIIFNLLQTLPDEDIKSFNELSDIAANDIFLLTLQIFDLYSFEEFNGKHMSKQPIENREGYLIGIIKNKCLSNMNK